MEEKITTNLTVDKKLSQPEINVCAPSKKSGEIILDKIKESFVFGDRKKVSFKVGDGCCFTEIKDIIYAEVYRKELTVFTDTGQIKTKQPLSSLLEKLPEESFIQVSRSSVININKIKKLEVAFSGNWSAHLQNNLAIIVSRRFVEKLKVRLGL